MNITNILHQLSIHFISFHLPATCAGCPCWAAAGVIQTGHFVSVKAPGLEKACLGKAIIEEFIKTLWFHRQRIFPLLACA